MRLDRLTIFGHLWAIAAMTESARWMIGDAAWSWVLLPPALALLAFPRSVTCLVIWALTQTVFHSLAVHTPWNHGLFIALMNVAILISVARVGWTANRDEVAVTRAAIVDHFAPSLRLSLILLYGFAFLHKLNWDYLDPASSCADQVLTWLDTRYRVLPTGRWLTTIGIWSSLMAEGGVALLLCFRRTIGFGLVLGFSFHLFLSQFGGLYGFAAAMYAVYFLFLPATFTDDVSARRAEILRRLGLEGVQAWLNPALAMTILTTVFLLHQMRGSPALFSGLWWWNAWVIGTFGCFAWQLVRALRATTAAPLTPAWAPLWITPLLVTLSGFSPYLGLKTETSWSMYSNLRTEIRPNHLFMPHWLKIAGYQDDLVEVVETSLRELRRHQEERLLVPFFEFQRISSTATQDFRVVYRRNGSLRVLESTSGVSSDPVATRAPDWLTGKLLRFRPVDATAAMKCRH